jgi:VCBS repeat-containing protein
MKKYLGGNLLNYFKLVSKNNVDTSYAVTTSDFGVLTIECDESWTTTTSNEATNLYTQAGWNVETNASTAFTATSTDGKIHVSFERKGMSDDTIVIKATYDEDYNKDAVTATWDADILSVFSFAFGTATIPYVYLGTASPVAYYTSRKSSVELNGGKWNDRLDG